MSMSTTRDDKVRANDPNAADSKTAAPRTVLSMNEMRMFALEVGDENGIKQRVVAFRINGTWCHDPAGTEWLGRLRPISPEGWLAKTLEERLGDKTAPVSVPKSDAVDIMGGGKAKG